MAGQTKDAWDEVGKHFAELGRKLGEHYKQQAETTKEESEAARKKLNEAVRTLTDQVDRAFTSLGDTLRDPDASQHLDRAVKSLGTALSTTFNDVSEEIRRRVKGSTPGSK